LAGDLPRREDQQSLLEETVEDLYDNAPCAYLSTLPDGTIVRVNQTLLKWTGYGREALLGGTKFQSLLSTGSRIYFETHYAPLLQMQGIASEIAFEVRCADGRTLPVIANSLQTRADDGTPLFNRITLFDSTERKRYERELLLARRRAEQIVKDKVALLSMLSHDIRNPLNALMGVVQLLDRSELTDQQRRHLGLLKSSSENMLKLLDRVLELSKAESSSYTLGEAAFGVGPLVEDVVSTFGPTADAKGLTVRSSTGDLVPSLVVGDPIVFRQILTNLVGNAIKFTQQGSVTVAVDARELTGDSATLEFSVSDTGIGIPPDRLDRIFNEFTQASYETATAFGGSGLGLAISRKLLALYGSQIHVASVVGAGSTFSFSVRLDIPPRGQ
jgi:PAS domain S-box-containing protein